MNPPGCLATSGCCAASVLLCKAVETGMMCVCTRDMQSNSGGRKNICQAFWRPTRRTGHSIKKRTGVTQKFDLKLSKEFDPKLVNVLNSAKLEDVQLQRRGLLGWVHQPWLVSTVVGYVKWCPASIEWPF